ncbi:Serine/threonine-protein kinase PrkC [Crateriforma conspicua]|nr:Serine/threonine-protein kinase PrkC [Crateriforma conspicua]
MKLLCPKNRRSNPNPSGSCPIMSAVIDTIKTSTEEARSKAGQASASDQESSDPLARSPMAIDRNRLAETTPTPVGANASRDAALPPAGDNQANMRFLYEPGSTPLPRYTIRRGLGVGGFGEVYFAVSEAGKEVALKRIQRNLDVELRGVSQCLNLKHANLVALYDICRDENDGAWVVMEYVAGKNLRQILDENPNGLPEGEARRWFREMCAGVDHLHSAGLVHRDLKPGNLFDDMGVVKVGDYGLSKFISASHRGGHTESVGTFHYMAPEIGRGEYGREIDIYALGVILFELLTGRVPFDGESCHEIIVKHLTALPDLSSVSSPYREVIDRALQKDPARRPSSIAELLQPLGLTTALPAVGQLSSSPPVGVDPVYTATVTGDAARTPRAKNGQPVGKQADAPEIFVGRAVSPVGPVHEPNPTMQEEPIARAVRHGFRQLGGWWDGLERSPGAKTALVIIGIITLVFNTHWLVPMLWVLGFIYVPYYVVRNIVLHVRQQPTYAQAQRIADSHAVPHHPITRDAWRRQMRNGLRAKHTVTRVAELCTSSIAAILTCLFLAVAAGVIGLRRGPVGPAELAPYGLLAAIGMIATLPLLLLGKLWEREEGESLRRRIALAGLGAGIGLATFAISQYLLLPVDAGLAREIDSTDLPQAFYADNGVPYGAAFVAHFALLLAGLRWWKMVDPLRKRRLSLWSVAVAVVGEWLIHQVLPIPQPSGMMLAGGIAIAVQMSAPWVNPALAKDKDVMNAGRRGVGPNRHEAATASEGMV